MVRRHGNARPMPPLTTTVLRLALRSRFAQEARHALRACRWVNQDFLKSGAPIVVANVYIGSIFQENLYGIFRPPASRCCMKQSSPSPERQAINVGPTVED